MRFAPRFGVHANLVVDDLLHADLRIHGGEQDVTDNGYDEKRHPPALVAALDVIKGLGWSSEDIGYALDLGQAHVFSCDRRLNSRIIHDSASRSPGTAFISPPNPGGYFICRRLYLCALGKGNEFAQLLPAGIVLPLGGKSRGQVKALFSGRGLRRGGLGITPVDRDVEAGLAEFLFHVELAGLHERQQVGAHPVLFLAADSLLGYIDAGAGEVGAGDVALGRRGIAVDAHQVLLEIDGSHRRTDFERAMEELCVGSRQVGQKPCRPGAAIAAILGHAVHRHGGEAGKGTNCLRAMRSRRSSIVLDPLQAVGLGLYILPYQGFSKSRAAEAQRACAADGVRMRPRSPCATAVRVAPAGGAEAYATLALQPHVAQRGGSGAGALLFGARGSASAFAWGFLPCDAEQLPKPFGGRTGEPLAAFPKRG